MSWPLDHIPILTVARASCLMCHSSCIRLEQSEEYCFPTSAIKTLSPPHRYVIVISDTTNLLISLVECGSEWAVVGEAGYAGYDKLDMPVKGLRFIHQKHQWTRRYNISPGNSNQQQIQLAKSSYEDWIQLPSNS